MKKVILAYSGGLDTSVILKWLQREKGCEVVAFTADVGQQEDLKGVSTKALVHGAVDAVLVDLQAKFASEYVFYEGYYLLGTSISRPLIAKELTLLAKKHNADAIVHGATGKGNDQVRFELSAYAIDPKIQVIAPWREWSFLGRADLEDYARKHDVSVPTTVKDPWSHDGNLLHSSYEGGVLEDPWQEPPEHLFRLTRSIHDAPNEAEYIEIEFKCGDAISVNGKSLAPEKILAHLNETAGKHGIGRVDLVENRYVGIKSRGVYETPGGTILFHARRAVESITLDREVLHQRDQLSGKYAELVYNGYWFSPEREALQTYVDHVAQSVSGLSRLKLLKGNCTVVGRRSATNLYDMKLATFEADDVYNQADAEGFIKINSLRLRAQSHLKQKVGSGHD
ncbi:MAG: argininosuccinate synthase [Proteobacteria bacterium]|nr:argininosuccinate synthase [Pseudomonadota bacterium]